MKLAIIGFGKMGKEIVSVAESRGHYTVTIDPHNETADFPTITERSLAGVDVAIEFTKPTEALGNIEKVLTHKTNLVVGTTGWYDDLDEVKKLVDKQDGGLLWSRNFSVGVNLFFDIIKQSANIMNNMMGEYDLMAHEYHHGQKADSPSGTSEMIARILIDEIDQKEVIIYDKLNRAIKSNELHVSSTRGGHIPGIHSVLFDSPADSIEIKHTARSRRGFALGAVLAAEFMNGKKGCYTMKELMQDILTNQ